MYFYISYSRLDEPFKGRIAGALAKAGHIVSSTRYGMPMVANSNALDAQVKAVSSADAVILLLSPDAARDENLDRELEAALNEDIPIWPVLVRGKGPMEHFLLPRALRGNSGVYCDLRVYPDRIAAFLSTFFVYTGLALNDNSQAEVAWYDLAIAIDPTNAAAYHMRGNVHGEQGKRQQAIDDFSQSIRLNALVPEPYANRARQYRLSKQYDLALADCDGALRLDTNHRMAYIIRGNVEIEREHYAQAVLAFDAALALDSQDALSYANRGNAKRLMGKTEAALMDCNRALDIDPNRWLALLIRGQVHDTELEKQKLVSRTDPRLALALADFNAVLDVVENGDAYYGRARIHYWTGDIAGAVADCKKTLMIHPGHPAAQRIRTFIEQFQKPS